MKMKVLPAEKRPNRRAMIGIVCVLIFLILITLYIVGASMNELLFEPDFSQKLLPPTMKHPFGTDFLGRDMFARTIKGLSLSMFIGATASGAAAVIALIVGIVAALGKTWLDHFLNWVIDLTMGIPHTVLLILIAIATGRGITGLIIGISLTHWTGIARIIRGEVLQIRSRRYITASRKLGKSRLWVAVRHILPHMIPQFFIGLVLQFPHAIMHESGLTFLGYGMPPETPAIGIILSESMRYLSAGMWWLAFFPGAALAIVVLLIDKLGESLKLALDPASAQE
ncbi:MAG: ABC transporter permease [Oscillospiraceae bacterium]|jgi:peptide/nickel transport system permease protein|nr:ABC transporter permease [Oscillospiraceae bacterium]